MVFCVGISVWYESWAKRLRILWAIEVIHDNSHIKHIHICTNVNAIHAASKARFSLLNHSFTGFASFILICIFRIFFSSFKQSTFTKQITILKLYVTFNNVMLINVRSLCLTKLLKKIEMATSHRIETWY